MSSPGLPLTIFLSNSAEEWAKLLHGLFKFARVCFGEDEARRLFVRSTKHHRGKSAHLGSGEVLLAIYDDVLAQNQMPARHLPGALAELLYATRPGGGAAKIDGIELEISFGNSSDAIEKRLRRLLSAREKSLAESAAAVEARLAAQAHPTILTGVKYNLDS